MSIMYSSNKYSDAKYVPCTQNESENEKESDCLPCFGKRRRRKPKCPTKNQNN